MKTNQHFGLRDHETTDHRTTQMENPDGRVLVTRTGLAVALGVSLRTVDRMLADGEIEPVRLRGWSVRFHIPDVVQGLTQNLATRKHGRRARGARAVDPPSLKLRRTGC